MGSARALAPKTCGKCGGTFEADAVFCPKDGTKLLGDGAPGSDDDLPPDTDPYIGTVIGGDIEIRSVAGAGAMGRVYRAHQRGIDRDVAVKILHRELSGNAQLVSRFHREAKIASKLQHPHVVEVYLAGQLPDRALYIVMEYLDGMSLAAAIKAAGGSMPIERALSIALQICDAVGEGHARGIVHRDLKPENVMLVRRAEVGDWVKVLDFGIAKVSLGEQSMETQAGLIFGTARYISPEGAQGATVGPAGDVYSLAVMVYQMLAGQTPFDAEQPVGLLIKHIHENPPPIRSLPKGGHIPEPIARVVMENLAKDAVRRLPSARAFANALAAAAKEANVSFSDVGVVARMSHMDVSVARAMLEPTLDDAAAMPALVPSVSVSPAPSPAPRGLDKTQPSDPPPQVIALTRPPQLPPSPETERASHEGSTPPATSKRPWLVIVLAFLLGAAIAGLVVQHFGNRRDEARDAQLAKARIALAEGRYVAPPGDNVREVVTAALVRWPGDVRFLQIKSDAAHELDTRAMAARSAGDIGQARDQAKLALDFDPSDHTAKMLFDQYEDELKQGSSSLRAPSVMLEVPIGRTRAGQKVELMARIVVNGTAPKNTVTNPRFTVSGPGLKAPLVLVAVPGEGGTFRSQLTPPRTGSYEIQFEATTEGVVLRAERDLDVNR